MINALIEDKPQPKVATKVAITNLQHYNKKNKSQTPPFLMTFKIFNQNIHHFLMDSGASSSVMSYSVCEKLGIRPRKSTSSIIQLDRTDVKVICELKEVLIRLLVEPMVHHIIDILLVNVPEAYSILLSRD